MKTIHKMVTEVAPTNSPVLICGETGTGKEVLARRIHSHSRHFDKPLGKIPCAWVSGDRLSEHLARHSRPIAGDLSNSTGTLFLDELGDLDAASQAVLLRALSVGETTPISSRVISSTNRDLVEETRKGRFRSDLYHLLSGVCFHLPPLRERTEDIPALLKFLLAKHAAQLGRRQPALCAESLETMFSYPWPGNVRELENLVVKIIVLGDEKLVVSELQCAFASSFGETSIPRIRSLKTGTDGLAVDRARTEQGGANTPALEPQVGYRSRLYKRNQFEIEENKAS